MRAFIILLLFFLPPTLGAYDYYQLVLQWAPTYCTGQKNCRIPSPVNFTIHGLWPSDSITGKIPACSTTGVWFNRNVITSLTSELHSEWPNLAGSDADFWRHEWKKHGMCSNLDNFQYFNITLILKNRVDLLQYLVLSQKKITPSPSAIYTSSDISAAIQSQTGFIPYMWCKPKPGVSTQSLLLEISICVDMTAENFMDCPIAMLQKLKLNQCKSQVSIPDK
ncbi:ribonuclease 1-like [Fagus crenata]